MNWISNVVPPKIRSFLRRETPENLWVKCPESGQLVFHKDLEANLFVVPGSGYHMAIGAKARLISLFDNGRYDEFSPPASLRACPLRSQCRISRFRAARSAWRRAKRSSPA
jgi:acetyl-CoA carboxylase carboxyl transferase subunit beta